MADPVHYRRVDGGRFVAKCGADVPASGLSRFAARSTCIDCLRLAQDDALDALHDAQAHYAAITEALSRLEAEEVPRG